MPPGITWSVLILFGIFLGGLVSALMSGTFKWRKLPDKQWTEIFGHERGEALDHRVSGGGAAGVCGGHRGRLHQRPGDLRRRGAGPGVVHLHRRHVCLGHRDGDGDLPEEVLRVTSEK